MTATRCPTASTAGSAVPTRTPASPNGPSSGAAPNSHAVATLTHRLGPAWSSHWRSSGPRTRRWPPQQGLIEAAEATRNPYALSFALMAYGFACHNADPDRALEAMRRGLVIAQDSGNRTIEALPGVQSGPTRSRTFGDPLAALDYSAVAIRNHHDSGNTANMPSLAGCARRYFSTGSDAMNRRRPSAGFARQCP